MISSALAVALEANREKLNALFAQARRDAPQLDGPAFLDLLRRRIDPLVVFAVQFRSEHVTSEVESLYAVTLELFSKGLIGPQARYPHFEASWFALMQGAARFSMRELVGPLTNGLLNLTTTPRCRPHDWVRLMSEVAAECQNTANLLQAGQVAAWLCGMAHFREQSLAIACLLPDAVLARLFQIPAGDAAGVAAIVDQLQRSPWCRFPSQVSKPGLEVVAEVGGFRGLGGEFLRPPQVLAGEGGLVVQDGTDHWVLMADAFGATFHRVRGTAVARQPPGSYKIDKAGLASGPRLRETFAWLAGASSSASTETTLAVTLPHSHRIFLLSEVGC